MDKMSKQQKRIIFFSVGIVLLLIVSSLVIHLVTSDEKNSDEIRISNLDDLVKNIPNGKKDDIISVLDDILKENNKELDTSTVKDALIREGSESQSEVIKGIRYDGTFIVDIESLKQSYRITYSHTSDTTDVSSSGYPVIASCLDLSELKFGDFSCKDSSIDSNEKTDDPVLSKLPYTSNYYTINSVFDENNNPTLVIQVMLNHNSDSTKRFFNQYIDDALNWIKTQGGDIKNYQIEYRDMMNETVTREELK